VLKRNKLQSRINSELTEWFSIGTACVKVTLSLVSFNYTNQPDFIYVAALWLDKTP